MTFLKFSHFITIFLQWPWLQALLSILHKHMKLQQYFYNDYDVKVRYNKIQTKILLYIRSDICHDNLDIWPRIFIQGHFNSLLIGSFFWESQNKMWYTEVFLQSRLQQPWTSMKVSSKSVPTVIIRVKVGTILGLLK